VRLARFGGRHVAIAFALALAGAIAACSGDDSVTPPEGTGGAGGSSVEGGKGGGGAGGDASPDRADAKTDAPPGSGGSGGSGGTDASTDRGGGGTGGSAGADASPDASGGGGSGGGGGGVDASPDVVTQPDAPRETSVDSAVPDQAAEARADAGPDGNDGAVTPTPDAGPDVTPDRAPDVTPTVDANDAALSIDGGDAATVSFLPSQVPDWVGNDSPISPNDAGQLTWSASYPEAGVTVELAGSYASPQNWTGFNTLEIRVRIVSGAASIGTVQAFVHSTGGGNAFSGEEHGVSVDDGAADQVGDGDHTFFLNLGSGLDRTQVTDIEIDITPAAGYPPNTVIEVLGFDLTNT